MALVIMMLIFAFQYAVIQLYNPSQKTVTADVTHSEIDYFHSVVRVVDGDTFVYLSGDEEKTVRLLGVNTPETKDPRKPVQCFGIEASNEARRLLSGNNVRLVTDKIGDSIDKYGRELRYVYLSDGTMLNEHLVAEGFAHATPEYSFSQKDHFVNLENEARMTKKGLWDPEICPTQ